MENKEIHIFTDGGSRGNPGNAASAAVVKSPAGEILEKEGKFLGIATNNMAEYEGLLMGLNFAKSYPDCAIKLHMDSELIVMQMNGAYRVKEPRLKEMWEKAKALRAQVASIKIVHVRREYNKDADLLVNEVLDAQ